MDDGVGTGSIRTAGVARGLSSPADWRRPVARDEPNPRDAASAGPIDAVAVFRRLCHMQDEEHASLHQMRRVRKALLDPLADCPDSRAA